MWICVSAELGAQLVWETNKNADDFIKEVTESLPRGIRATIEESK